MITIRYNRDQVLAEFGSQQNALQILKSIESKLEEAGQVLCQFRVNGAIVEEHQDEWARGVALSEIQNVEILVDRPDQLLAAVIHNWIDEIPGLIKKSDECATRLRSEPLPSLAPQFVRLMDTSQFLVDSLISIQSLSKSPRVRSPEWKSLEEATVKTTGEALEAFEKKDANLLADVIEYDLADAFQRWFEVLKEIERESETQTASSESEAGSSMGPAAGASAGG